MPDNHLDVALAEVLANAIYACDNEPPLNARTVPHRWAIYQKQARNIVWPKILPALLAAGWTPPTPTQGEGHHRQFLLTPALVEAFTSWVDATGEHEGRSWQMLVDQLDSQL